MAKATDRLSYNWKWMFFVKLGFNGTCESRQASNQEREVQRVEMWGHAWMWRIQKVRKQSFTFSRVVFVRTIIVVTAEGLQGQEQPAAVQKKFLQQWLVAVREKEKVKTLIGSVYYLFWPSLFPLIYTLLQWWILLFKKEIVSNNKVSICTSNPWDKNLTLQ